jgi:hypothetical protein
VPRGGTGDKLGQRSGFDKGYGEKSLSELTPEDCRVRLVRDYKIKEIFMAKVIEFYLPKNFRKPLKWVPQLQCGKVFEFCLRTKKSA